MTTFHDFALREPLQRALVREGYTTPTPIQMQAIPQLLNGRDLLGIAQTGTGKTAAFAVPTLNLLSGNPSGRRGRTTRALVLAPTRELAIQIGESFKTYAHFTDTLVRVVFGGVPVPRQVRALERGCDVLVATPGRLLDLTQQRAIRLDEVEVLILDEADQMFDMGFIHDLKKIVSQTPNDRQTMLFSATMPDAIAELAEAYLKDPVTVSVVPESTTAERVTQGAYYLSNNDKPRLLETVLGDKTMGRALVFTRTKHGADRVARKLMGQGLRAETIHGNKSQGQRVRALDAFRKGESKILIATDIAARGIDIDGISHVINFEMPNVPEQYVHRIGRTARAGREGVAISFVAEDELYYLRDIERRIGQKIPTLDIPEGCEDFLQPAPDHVTRPRKPKGRTGGREGGEVRADKGPRREKRAAPDRKPRPPRVRDAEVEGVESATARPARARPSGPRPERSDRPERAERPARGDFKPRRDRDSGPRRDREDRSERGPRPDREARGDRPHRDRPPFERRERAEGGERQERRDRPERSGSFETRDRPRRDFDQKPRRDYAERADRPHREGRPDRGERPERAERPYRANREDRPDRADRQDRPDRRPRRDDGRPNADHRGGERSFEHRDRRPRPDGERRPERANREDRGPRRDDGPRGEKRDFKPREARGERRFDDRPPRRDDRGPREDHGGKPQQRRADGKPSFDRKPRSDRPQGERPRGERRDGPRPGAKKPFQGKSDGTQRRRDRAPSD